LRFGLDAFAALDADFTLVLSMFLTYLAAKRWLPRYAIVLVLLVGLAVGRGSCVLGSRRRYAGVARHVNTTPSLMKP